MGQQNDKVKDIIDFVEVLFLTVILTIGYGALVATEQNGIAVVLFVLPCFTSSIFRFIREEQMHRAAIVHLIAFVVSLLFIALVVYNVVKGKNIVFFMYISVYAPAYELSLIHI